MKRREPQRLRDLLPGVIADLAARCGAEAHPITDRPARPEPNDLDDVCGLGPWNDTTEETA